MPESETPSVKTPENQAEDEFVLAGYRFHSRLLMGSSGYANQHIMLAALQAGRTEIVTAAIRRVNLTGEKTDTIAQIAESGRMILPNTAGCFTARDAVLTAELARESLQCNWIKLEVIGDGETLYPDPVELLAAAQTLVKSGFAVLPYCGDDPVMCRRLADLGCAAVMPLASPIGSGNGILNPYNLEIIRRHIEIPLIVDAGIGAPSDAAKAMELGADGVLLNSAVAKARDPVAMALAMRLAVQSGRLAAGAGRIPKLTHAEPSSPLAGLLGG